MLDQQPKLAAAELVSQHLQESGPGPAMTFPFASIRYT